MITLKMIEIKIFFLVGKLHELAKAMHKTVNKCKYVFLCIILLKCFKNEI